MNTKNIKKLLFISNNRLGNLKINGLIMGVFWGSKFLSSDWIWSECIFENL